jgi:hypothetical protein
MSKLLKVLCEEFGVEQSKAPTAFDPTDQVDTKLERAKKIEEFDTITFGLETDDGRIIKVYVKAEQADKFEVALSQELGKQDVIEDVLNKLSKDFDIIDVEWPDSPEGEEDEDESNDELTVDDVDMGDEENEDELETDGSESMNKQVWGKPAKTAKHLVKKESDMSYGQLFTKKLLGESSGDPKSVTLYNPNSKLRVQITKHGLNDYYVQYQSEANDKGRKFWSCDTDNQIKKDLRTVVAKMAKQGYTKGAEKFLGESQKEFNSVDDIVEVFGKKRLVNWLNNGDDKELEDALYEYYTSTHQMPYGTMKARDDDPQNWIADHFPDDLVQSGYIEKTTHKWIGEAITQDEAESTAQPTGRRFKVGLLDNRFSTQFQFMVYQALLDLGIPDEALFKAPQKNAIVAAIKETAKTLQYDPVRRQALRWLITRLEQVSDLTEAKKKEDEEMTPAEKKEFDKIKVGVLDDRFTNSYQKMLYQTILMLGLPDSFMAKSAFKNVIINSIKEKAKEIMRDSVKRSAVRVFTHRFQEKEGKEVAEGVIQNLPKGVSRPVVQNTKPKQRPDMIVKLSTDGQRYVVVKVNDKQLADTQDGGYTTGDMFKKSLLRFNKATGLADWNGYSVALQESLTESAGSDTVEFLEFFMDAVTPENKKGVLENLKGSSAWTTYKRSVISNPELGTVLASIRAPLSNVAKKLAVTGAGNPMKEHLKEAKWGDEPMLDDPEDKETDPDTKVKVKMPARKKDVKVGEEAQWTIGKNKKTGDLTIETNGIRITLDDESAEKLMKAMANKSIVVLPDADFSDVKWIFSPRARTYLVKKAGAKGTNSLILSWEDTNKIEDVYSGK